MDRNFFARNPVRVAEQLIGCKLVRRTGQGIIRVRITETEAYRGADDPASHAHRGPTPRNTLMFGTPGHLYVYLIYGLHHCLNIVAHPPGEPGAVLIRAAVAERGMEVIRSNRPGVADGRLMDGPGKLAKALGIDLSHNGFDLFAPSNDAITVEPSESRYVCATSGRIGIKAGLDLPWRFTGANKQIKNLD
ncbi:DNA-3-methyladenine glycosylase [Paenibacillus darwinianus]|uniref:Putative 3-methyladenine DNA glycosylase n=1 Tax=Paenibacillus darwinianus TaxID=1380763 RepID=A0A9W5W744_9BACL|nr:DNA-3-methyladenine glycosylase [Paenibacillus darwinianus]EXX87676.1 DNA-3-methyladenine glycosylase [Paenibacillus darwinianus]EXX90065.1 DNA-3-methyladenine glycosylase [Paenibacillus darwinianus]EXX90889.1 DNA-3-methyladenine glycosylase [Paenibacillus darwinianus]